jgi:hypothetical protein
MREITLSQAANEARQKKCGATIRLRLSSVRRGRGWHAVQNLSAWSKNSGTDALDTPIGEPGFMAFAVGAAMTERAPIVDLMFGDLIFDHGLPVIRRPKPTICRAVN